MTLEELLEKMYAHTDVGIRCASIEERERVGDFLLKFTNGQRGWWDNNGDGEMIVFFDNDDECFKTTDVCCSADVFYADIAHLLSDKPVVPVIVDDLI